MNKERKTPDTRDDLLKRRQALVDRIDAIRADFRRGLSTDSEERAVELENFDTLAEIERVANLELAEVEKRLAAIDASAGQ